MASPGVKGPYPEYIAIRIVNSGNRDVKITSIGWQVGFFKAQRQHAIQIIDKDGLSSDLPILLRYGEEANYLIHLGVNREWLEKFIKDCYIGHHKSRVKYTKIWVSTSIGKTFKSTIEKGLQNIILKSIGKQHNLPQGKFEQ